MKDIPVEESAGRPAPPANFKCRKCGRVWWQPPGPTVCQCGHMYLDWLNADIFGENE